MKNIFSIYKSKVKSDNCDFFFSSIVLIISLLLGFAKIQYSQHEDMGLFLSQFGLIGSGHLPYKDIYEHKDPLFLAAGGLIFYLFGIQGVYLQDIFLLLIGASLSYKISRKFKLNPFFSALASTVFILTLFGNYYQTLRSTLFAMVLLLIYINLFLEKKFIFAGFVVVLIGCFKMPFLIITPSMAALVLFDNQIENKQKFFYLFKLITGFFIALLFIGLILLKLDLFNYYISMVKDNFLYAKIFPEIVGMPKSFFGIKNMSIYGSNFYFCLAILLLVSFFAIIKLPKNYQPFSFTLILLSFSTIILSSLMIMWPHHLHIMVYFIWPISILILFFLQNFFTTKEIITENYNKYIAFLLIISFVFISSFSGTSVPKKFSQSPYVTLFPSWYKPPEASLLDDSFKKNNLPRKFARLGANDDMGLGAFLDKNWRLVCARFSQGGVESSETVKAILSCMEQNPNYLIVSESFFNIERSKGTFTDFKIRAKLIVDNNFRCEPVAGNNKRLICVRK